MATESNKKPKATEVRKTEFSLSVPQAKSVFIAGDFNQWNPSSHPIKIDDKGICDAWESLKMPKVLFVNKNIAST